MITVTVTSYEVTEKNVVITIYLIHIGLKVNI